MLNQVSVFLENKPGSLAAMTRKLQQAGVNMRLLAVADTTEFGIVRILCDKPDYAIEALKTEGFVATQNPVVAVSIEDEVGSLADLFEFAAEKQVDIAYAYCFVDPFTHKALGVLKVEDLSFEEELKKVGYQIIDKESIFNAS